MSTSHFHGKDNKKKQEHVIIQTKKADIGKILRRLGEIPRHIEKKDVTLQQRNKQGSITT